MKTTKGRKPVIWHIEHKELSTLDPFDSNPRRFTDKGLKDLEKSILSFGLAEPIVVNTDGTVIGGHARLEVLRKTGVKSCDCYVPDRKLTRKEVEELNVRLNANIAGEWDWDILQADFDLGELKDWGMDVPLSVDDIEIKEPEFQSKSPMSVYRLYVESKDSTAFRDDIELLIASKYPTALLQKHE